MFERAVMQMKNQVQSFSTTHSKKYLVVLTRS